MWSSLSGAGRFVSRAGSGILTDLYGFPKVAFIAFSLQLLVAVATCLYLFCCECSLANREPEAGGLRWEDVTVVEQGSRREDKVVTGQDTRLQYHQSNHCPGCVLQQLLAERRADVALGVGGRAPGPQQSRPQDRQQHAAQEGQLQRGSGR